MGAAAGPIAAGTSIASAGIGLEAAYESADAQRMGAQGQRVQGQARLLEGQGRQQEYATKAQNYLLEGEAKSTNYLYEGAAKKAESGIEASRDEVAAARAERAAEFGRLQADLTDVTMREDLNRTLGNIDVIRAAAHTDPTSPTGAAVAGREAIIADRQREASLVGIHAQISEDEASAAYMKSAAGFALTQGDVAERMAGFNADVATKYAGINAASATKLGQVALQSGVLGKQASEDAAAAADRAADATETAGWAKLLGSIGKGFA